MSKLGFRFLLPVVLLGLTFSVGQSTIVDDAIVSAIELSPNIKNSLIVFEPTEAIYEYTGSPITPTFSVQLTEVVDSSEYTYTVISDDDKNDGTSSGIYPGKVTIEITGTGDFSFGYYGTKTASFEIVKADGLEAKSVRIPVYSHNGSFDLNEIILNKTDCGECTYTLDNLTDENGVLSEISITGSTLNYSVTGSEGTAEQIITITTENYEDIDVVVTFESENLLGDCNFDGVLSVSDVVMLQKWLLGAGELTCWQNADLCKDNIIDVFDLCVMKRKLLENYTYDDVEEINMNMTPSNMPAIIDNYDEITDDMKSMLWETLSQSYPNVDFTDFTFVYAPDHPLTDLVDGKCFYVYFRDILVHGYGDINTYSNVYAAITDKGMVQIELIADPEIYCALDLDVVCISEDALKQTLQYEAQDIEKIVYVDTSNDDFSLKLAYRVVEPNGDGEEILDAITGEQLAYISYFVY